MACKKYPKRKSIKKYQSQDNLLSGTNQLAKTTIKAYEKGGMPLVLVIVGLIGFVLTFFLRTAMETSTFVVFVIIEVLLFLLGVLLYCKEKKIF